MGMTIVPVDSDARCEEMFSSYFSVQIKYMDHLRRIFSEIVRIDFFRN